MRYVWSLLGLVYALLNLYVAYLFITSAVGPRLSEKGVLFQVAPLLGGVGLFLFALPLVWNCVRLVTSRG